MSNDSSEVKKDKEWLLNKVEAENIRFIKLCFTDILGFLKSLLITKSELPKALEEGMGFDGSSIKGFTRIDESDMIAKPDISSFRIFPWEDNGCKVGIMFADIFTPDGKPFEGDTRYILKKNLEDAKKMGYTFYVGPELEYFYLRDSKSFSSLDYAGYFDLITDAEGLRLRQESVLALECMGIRVEYSHHECAHSQHEIDLAYEDALTMADIVSLYRYIIKEVARRNGCYATFTPKPVFGQNGSGMHTHMSLFKDGRNAFFDMKGIYHLSDTALSFIAGILKFAPEITLITNQWVNSYKRLVPGYEAPVYISWAQRNRSDLIRIPMYKPGKEQSTRIEYRAPDPACNPYLTFAVLLQAGLEGIRNKLQPPPPVEENVYEMSEEERKERGINSLPGSLIEAIKLCEGSKLVAYTLGSHVLKNFIENKKIEWDNYRKQITDYEIKTYLPIL